MWQGETARDRVQPPARPGGPQPEPKPVFDERRLAAWIGKSVFVKGHVACSEDLTIDGHVEGTIELGGHNLTIGAGAAVKANLVAKVVTISGAVTGNVRATDKVELRSTGSVDGDIAAPRLVMSDGAVLIGGVDAGGKSPSSDPSSSPDARPEDIV